MKSYKIVMNFMTMVMKHFMTEVANFMASERSTFRMSAFGRVLDMGACSVLRRVGGGLAAGRHAARAAQLVGWLQMSKWLCLMQEWKMRPMKAWTELPLRERRGMLIIASCQIENNEDFLEILRTSENFRIFCEQILLPCFRFR